MLEKMLGRVVMGYEQASQKVRKDEQFTNPDPRATVTPKPRMGLIQKAYDDVFLNHGDEVPMTLEKFADHCTSEKLTRAQLANTEFMCDKVDSWTGGLGPPIG
jgi:hypothetical protein